jgi:hypothetical protein
MDAGRIVNTYTDPLTHKHTYMYTYIYIYIYIHIYIPICKGIHEYGVHSTSVRKHHIGQHAITFAYIYIYTSVIYTNIYIRTRKGINMHGCIYMHSCIYIYIYIHVYIYLHIYTYYMHLPITHISSGFIPPPK